MRFYTAWKFPIVLHYSLSTSPFLALGNQAILLWTDEQIPTTPLDEPAANVVKNHCRG